MCKVIVWRILEQGGLSHYLGHIPDLEPPHQVKAVESDRLQTDLELLGNELVGSTVEDKMRTCR